MTPRRMRLTLILAVLVPALGACGSTKTSAHPDTTTTLPDAASAIGKPKVVASNGATAAVTLNGVRYAPNPSASSMGELAVVDLTITGTSTKPFSYSQDNVVFAYSDQDNPYAHSEDSHIYGSMPSEDYTPFIPPPPLRVGQVASGQTKRGLVILRMSTRAPYLLMFTDSSATPLVEWALTSK